MPEEFLHDERDMSRQMQECMDACRECQKWCVALETSSGLDSTTIQTTKDCSEMCETCSNFVMRESRFSADICKLCAEVCRACAAACDKTSQGSIAKECAAACRGCMETCPSVGSPVHALRSCAGRFSVRVRQNNANHEALTALR
jgi:hypothetical protein